MRRSPLAEELDHAAGEGRAETASLASRRGPRVRATRLPDAPVTGRAAAFARAMNDLFSLTPGGLFDEEP